MLTLLRDVSMARGTRRTTFMKNLKVLFDQRIDHRFADTFPEFTKRNYLEVPAVTSFVCKACDGLYFHILPDAIPKWNSFSARLCWMVIDKSPILARLGSVYDDPNEYGIRFSLSDFWTKHSFLWRVSDEEFWRSEEMVRSQLVSEGHEYEFDPVGVMFRPEEIDAWIDSHQDVYQADLTHEQRLVWPLTDHMIEKIIEYGIPYFEKIAAARGCEWRANSL